jgi:NhaP-type Na+/H+ or K+/H+ antiporter
LFTHDRTDQVIFGIVLGSIIGTAFRYMLRHSRKHGYIDRDSFVAQYLALAVFSSGISNMLGSDDLLTAFAAGNAVSWDGHFNLETEDDFFAAILDLVLNCAGFIYIGTW